MACILGTNLLDDCTVVAPHQTQVVAVTRQIVTAVTRIHQTRVTRQIRNQTQDPARLLTRREALADDLIDVLEAYPEAAHARLPGVAVDQIPVVLEERRRGDPLLQRAKEASLPKDHFRRLPGRCLSKVEQPDQRDLAGNRLGL